MKFKSWNIPQSVLDETSRKFSVGRHEVFVIWTAPLMATEPVCEVKKCVVPLQCPGTSRWGVYVHIDGIELNRIQFDNYDRGERSVIQLHTHPSADVTMSELDMQWEVVKHVGALSIIVPSYGNMGLVGFPGASVYEREAYGWRLWSNNEIKERLRCIK